jgi:hypothetical protein
MKLETRKYYNDTEIMTVVKLRDDNDNVLEMLKVYNEKREVEIDSDFRITAERLDDFLLKFYELAKTTTIEFDTEIIKC